MNLTGTEKAVKVLRELVSVWDKVRVGLFSVRSIKGSGLAQVSQSADGVVIHVPPAPAPPTPTNPDGSVWLKIKSASSVGTNQWNYKVRVMKSGDTSSHTGLVETADTTEFDARNTWETITLAGYENTSVTALKVIPTAAIVRGVPEVRNGVRVYVFSERNEPTC